MSSNPFQDAIDEAKKEQPPHPFVGGRNATSVTKKHQPLVWENMLGTDIKVGDAVHVGHAVKGGAGVRGVVTKIQGDTVHLRSHEKDKFGYKTYKGRLKNAVKEDVEQIEELKRSTLASYTKKASGDAVDSALEIGRTMVDKAGADKRTRLLNRISKRERGINKAQRRLAKEDVEQIEELSKKTLTSYQDKAMQSASDLEHKSDLARRINKPNWQKRFADKASKRVDGAYKASRLAVTRESEEVNEWRIDGGTGKGKTFKEADASDHVSAAQFHEAEAEKARRLGFEGMAKRHLEKARKHRAAAEGLRA